MKDIEFIYLISAGCINKKYGQSQRIIKISTRMRDNAQCNELKKRKENSDMRKNQKYSQQEAVEKINLPILFVLMHVFISKIPK